MYVIWFIARQKKIEALIALNEEAPTLENKTALRHLRYSGL
jgi:hypothetical protein